MQLLLYVGLSWAFRNDWPTGTSRIKRKSLKCPRQSGQLNIGLVSQSNTTTRSPLHFAQIAGFEETLARNSSLANSAFRPLYMKVRKDDATCLGDRFYHNNILPLWGKNSAYQAVIL